MAIERDILRAVEGLPPVLLRQVKDFIVRLKEKKSLKRHPVTGEALAREQARAIKKWAGANLGQGFSGKDHDRVLYGSAR